MSFKSSGAQAQLEPEEFTYPQAPTAKASDANEAEKTKHLWTARAAGQEAPDPEESAKKEQLIWGRGAEAGRVQARAEFEQKLSKVHEEIGKALRQFAAERDSYFHAVEEQLVRLSLAMARKILHREAQVDSDVFENHHQPSRSVRDPHLVGIVAAADHFCERHGLDLSADGETQELSETDATCEDEFLRVCLPRLDAKERSELTEMLETEYLHLLPVIEFNNATDQILDEKKA